MNINIKNKEVQIIAECGLSHEGSLQKAKKFIKLVKKNGADVVKFQTHIAEKESTYDEKFRVKMSRKYKFKTKYFANAWRQGSSRNY